MSAPIRHRPPHAQPPQAEHDAPSGTELKRGSPTLRQAHAKTLGRGNARASAKDVEGGKKSGIKAFFKGAKLAITGGVQAATHERVARAAAGWAAMDKHEAKAEKARAKANDGRALMLSALRGTKLDATTAASVQARDGRRADAKAHRDAVAARKVDRRENH